MQVANAETFTKFVEKLKLRFPVATIAKETEYSKGQVSDYINGKKVPSEQFLKKFNEKFSKVPAQNVVNDEGQPYGGGISDKELSMQAILSLTRSNEKLANANADLSRSNLELTQLVTRFASSAIETSATSPATVADLLVLIAEVGSGKRWHSVDEALAALNKRFFDTQGIGSLSGTQSGSGN